MRLTSALNAGDTISVVAGAQIGSAGDKRKVGATSVTIAAKPADRSRPSVSVILIAGEQLGYVSLTDNGLPLAGPLSANDVTVRLGTAAAQSLTAAGGDITAGNIDLGSGQCVCGQ